jgi:signal transduction histidine kinase
MVARTMRNLSLSQISKMERSAKRPLSLLTIKDLMQQRREIRQPGILLETARYMQKEIPLRIAHRLKDFHRLPAVALASEPFARTHELYLEAFDQLSAGPQIESVDDCGDFARRLRNQVDSHREVVPLMERAIRELQPFTDCQDELRTFLDKLFVTRIGNRVLAEHFLSCMGRGGTDGIVTDCELEPIIRNVAEELTRKSHKCYGTAPEIIFDVSKAGTEAPVIADHVRYITQEVLKNAIRASVETHGDAPPAIKVCIHQGTDAVIVKIHDRGGGLDKRVEGSLFDYGFTTASKEDVGYGVLGGYGLGLPLSRLYARYFGGDLTVRHMHGFGTTVVINLSRLGTQFEFDVSSDSDANEERRPVDKRRRRARLMSS